MARLAARSYLLVPLLARGRVLGAFTLLSTLPGPPLHGRRPVLRRDARRALRAGHRQRPAARRGEPLARPAGHDVRHRAGRPRLPRPRPALRARQRGAGRHERALRRGAPRPHGGGGPRRRGRPRGRRPPGRRAQRPPGARARDQPARPASGAGRGAPLGQLLLAGARARRRAAGRQRGGDRQHGAPPPARAPARGARGGAGRAGARRPPVARRRASSTPRWTTRRRCATWPTSPCPRWRTGAPSACSTRTAACVAVANAHADPAMQALGRDYEERFPLDPDAPSGPRRAWRARASPRWCARSTTRCWSRTSPIPTSSRFVRTLGLRSVIVAPLVARRRTFGTLTLAVAESGRRFGDEDVQLAEELARRAGVAIDNARLYTERSRIAHTLQARLLPERLPAIPGVAARRALPRGGRAQRGRRRLLRRLPAARRGVGAARGRRVGQGRRRRRRHRARALHAARRRAGARAAERGAAAAQRRDAGRGRACRSSSPSRSPTSRRRGRRAARPARPRRASAADGPARRRAGGGARASSGPCSASSPTRSCPTRRPCSGPGTPWSSTRTASRRPARAPRRSARTASRASSRPARARIRRRCWRAVEEAAVAAQPGEPRDDIALLAVTVEPRRPV